MILGLNAVDLVRLFAADVTTQTVIAADSMTPPADALYFGDPDDGEVEVPSGVELRPYGTGADAATFDFAVYGLRKVRGNLTKPKKQAFWSLVMLAKFACVLDASGTFPSASQPSGSLYCKTITIDTAFSASAGVSVEVLSPNMAGAKASVRVGAGGNRGLVVAVDLGTATAANLLVAPY